MEVTEWCPGEYLPTITGGYQVRVLDKPDEILWSYWNNGLKSWSAPHKNPYKARAQQFLPWRPRAFEWRARAK